MKTTIEHNEQEQLFYFEEDGKKGELKYYLEGKVMDMTHTSVPDAFQGQGYGNWLVETALDYAREKGYKIIPSCPFVEAYISRHSAAQDLVARS